MWGHSSQSHRCGENDDYGDLFPDPVCPIFQGGVDPCDVDRRVQARVHHNVMIHLRTSRRRSLRAVLRVVDSVRYGIKRFRAHATVALGFFVLLLSHSKTGF